ncbi:unnamed protein product [Brassicogethes aeneus]|uniref:MMS19 nucleotide excision repair protein n=1 Tax=Brassicogethes aeneus TaxID=1431903 RepID=A0A9P0B2K1_BRAAE|nr:unnamed protein product [Brassicogethes aeneus]
MIMDNSDMESIIHSIEQGEGLDLDTEDFKEICLKLIADVDSNKINLFMLTENLEYLLTNPMPCKRKLGIAIITHVLENIKSDSLNTQQLGLICKFYADRLKDLHDVIPVTLRGILALTRFNNFPDGSATAILSAIFNNIACQQQQQLDRMLIFSVFKALLEKHANELKCMGMDFVYGVLNAIDSERDPKNLLFLFEWLPSFLKTVSLGHLSEDMFEALACYFPVDFRAPPQDPNKVTREDLSKKLCVCLCAVPEFAEHCIPLAIEKLESSLLIAKLDSLELLKEGCQNFEIDAYLQHSSEIWSLIQKELLSCKDLELEKSCIETLNAFIQKLSKGDSATFTNILRDIFDTMAGNLLPGAKYFEVSCKLLIHVAIASKESAVFMVKNVVPILTNSYNIATIPAQKASLLGPLVGFMQAYGHYNTMSHLKETHEIVVVCVKSSIEEDLTLKRAGFESLTRIAKYLPPDSRRTTYENLAILLLKPDFKSRDCVLQCFKTLCEIYPEETTSQILDKLAVTNDVTLDLYLDSWCKIVDIEYFTKTTVEKLTQFAFKNNALNIVPLTYVKTLLEEHEHSPEVIKLIHNNIFDSLIEITLTPNETIDENAELLCVINKILRILIGNLSSNTQITVVGNLLGSIRSVKNKSENVYILLLDGILTRLKRDGHLHYEKTIISDLIEVYFKNPSGFIQQYSSNLLANIINKSPDDEIIGSYLEQIKSKCRECIKANDFDAVTNIAFSITKSLVMKNSHFLAEWEDLLIQLLERSPNAAKGFRIVLDDNCESLNKNSYCNISLFYKQKFFVSISNKLNANYTNEKISFLSAIGYLIEFVPRQVILMQFEKIKKLIILCLEHCQESDVLCILINTIKLFIINKETVMENNMEDFLERILNLSTFEASMNVRLAAIRCLQEYVGRYPVFKLLQFKNPVIKKLGFCIDDKKRFVRREAAKVRSMWFLLDSPE